MSGAGNSNGSGAPLDAERDVWLREALRHAPDADAGAPPGLSDAILRQARQAAASAATPAQRGARTTPASSRTRAAAARRTRPWASLWSWLMQPTVATGLAGVMVATLVGVMWWGQPIDAPFREANLPDAATPTARSEAPALGGETSAQTAPQAAAPAPAPAPAAAPAPTAAATVTTPAAPPAAPKLSGNSGMAATDVAPARLRSAQDAADLLSAKKLAAPEARPVPAEHPTAAKERNAAVDLADERAKRTTPAPSGATEAAAAAPVAAPNGRVTAGAPAERKREDEAAAETARPAAGTGPRDEPADPQTAKAAEPFPAAAAATAAAGDSSVTRRLSSSGSSAADSVDRGPGAQAVRSLAVRPGAEAAQTLPLGESPAARLRAAVAAWPEVWTWQRGNGAEQPMNDTLQAWLGQLDDSTRSRWQAGPAAATAGGGPALRLLRNGRLHTTVRIEAAAVRVETAGEPGAGVPAGASSPSGAPRAPLTAAAAAALKAALEQATP